MHTVDHHPNDFWCIKKKQGVIRQCVQEKYPGLPKQLPKVIDDNSKSMRYLASSSMLAAEAQLGISHQPLIVHHFSHVLLPKVQQGLIKHWDAFMASKSRYSEKNADPCSASPAIHISVWEHTFHHPHLTSETCIQHQECQRTLDELLVYLHCHALACLPSLVKDVCPEALERGLKWVVVLFSLISLNNDCKISSVCTLMSFLRTQGQASHRPWTCGF